MGCSRGLGSGCFDPRVRGWLTIKGLLFRIHCLLVPALVGDQWRTRTVSVDVVARGVRELGWESDTYLWLLYLQEEECDCIIHTERRRQTRRLGLERLTLGGLHALDGWVWDVAPLRFRRG